MKKILLETFGDIYRLTLPANADEQTINRFANLAWVCNLQGTETDGQEITSFCVSSEKLNRAVRAFRLANTATWFHATKWNAQARVRGKLLPSGLSFCHVSQRASGREYTPTPATVGNADYQNATDSEFTGWESRLVSGTSEQD